MIGWKMRILGLLMAWTGLGQAYAQYSNSWIDASKEYFRIKLAQEGIYRLTYQDLLDLGVPATSIDPRLLQLYHRGTELAIHVKHNQQPPDGQFQDGEYVEFYGRKNDGSLDADLYRPKSAQPHKLHNLYNDSSAYFLTWSTSFTQGRRMEEIDLANSTSLPNESTHQGEALQTFVSDYSGGTMYGNYISSSFYEEGEGWTGPVICTVNSGCTGQQDVVISLVNHVGSEAPILEIQLSGRDNLQHAAEIYAGPSVGTLRLITQTNFTNFETPVITASLSSSDVAADGKLVVRVKAIGVGGNRDRFSISYVRVKYPKSFDFTGGTSQTLGLTAKAAGRSFVIITNPPSGLRFFDVTDPTAPRVIGARSDGANLTMVVPDMNTDRQIFATSVTLGAAEVAIRRVQFRSLQPAAHNYLIVSHRSLMKPALGYPDAVRAYAGYRASTEGGGYDTLTVSVDQLYDQFNYGETSPRGIYEFVRFMKDGGQPQYLFLVGKGRQVYDRLGRRSLSPGELPDLVPTAGVPGSDALYSMSLVSGDLAPTIATGRLSVTTPAQVVAYLNKVLEEEAATNTFQPWRKKVLHLSGGIQANELTNFRAYMDGFATIAQGLYMGASVKTLGKHDPTTIQFIDVSNEVNEGVNFITFFGHSSATDTDIDIGKVSNPKLNYNNPGLYPAFLVNGCNAGEFFNSGTNFGEDWMIASARGARNFIANSSFGYDNVLRIYTDMFYRVGLSDKAFLGQGIGKVQREVARRLQETYSSENPVITSQVQQMVLLGDPALRIFPASLPDYQIDNTSIELKTFDNKPLSALADSMQVNVIVRNMGRAEGPPLKVRVTHTLASGVTTIVEKSFPDVLFQDTVSLTLQRPDNGFGGTQSIQVALDPDELVEEKDEGNNQAIISESIPFNGTLNLLPHDFGIVGSRDVRLLFQNTDVVSGAATFLIQIDSSENFDSPFLTTQEMQGTVLVSQIVTIPDSDSTVYYWRTRLKDRPEDAWETSSFVYINGGGTGWAQMEGPQFTDHVRTGLVETATPFELDFEPTSLSVFIRTYGSASATPSSNGSVRINQAEFYFSPQGFDCRNNTINLIAFNKQTLIPYRGVPFIFSNSGGRACGKEPQIINSFLPGETLTGNGDDLIKYVDNVGVGDSVILFSMGDAGFSSWSPVVKNKLEELGISSTAYDSFLPGEPVIILGRKGATAGSARIVRSLESDPTTKELQLAEELAGKLAEGAVRSGLIGPANRWIQLHQKYDSTRFDVIRSRVYGVATDRTETLLLEDPLPGASLASIDAQAFPYLRLTYEVTDSVELTPAQLNYWLIEFEEAPEGVVFADLTNLPLEKKEGEQFSVDIDFVNISSQPFADSLAVETRLINESSNGNSSELVKIKAPLPGDTTHFRVTGTTIGRVGYNTLQASVNKSSLTEWTHSNNSISLTDFLLVKPDRTSPVVDVTINGKYVSNGDWVSPNPTIHVTVKDENLLYPIADTTSLTLLLRAPCSEDCEPLPVYFSRSDISTQIIDGKLEVDFRPVNLEDGVYTLFAMGRDRTGNASGTDYLMVDFEVRSDASVIFYPPFPNPSPGVFFIEYRVAGEGPPEGFVFQVFNSSGRLVAELTDMTMPAMFVGMNRFRWSGEGPTGEYLPSGLYYYRFRVITSEGESVDSGKLMLSR